MYSPGFKSSLIYASKPYKEDMNAQSSGTMTLTDEEIKRYSDAIAENSDGDFPCPRCEVFKSPLKTNTLRHLKNKKGCKRAPSAVHISNDHNVHNDYSTQNNSEDHSTHTTNVTNNTNITMQLLPYNTLPYPTAEWEMLFENFCLKTIEKSLGCSLSDPAAALLACLRFEHLNADRPRRQTIRIKDGQMEQYGFDRGNKSKKSATWLLQELDKGLRDLMCRRRQDFHDVQGSLEQKMNKKPYERLIAGLDMLEALTNEGEAQTEEIKATFDKLLKDAQTSITEFFG